VQQRSWSEHREETNRYDDCAEMKTLSLLFNVDYCNLEFTCKLFLHRPRYACWGLLLYIQVRHFRNEAVYNPL